VTSPYPDAEAKNSDLSRLMSTTGTVRPVGCAVPGRRNSRLCQPLAADCQSTPMSAAAPDSRIQILGHQRHGLGFLAAASHWLRKGPLAAERFLGHIRHGHTHHDPITLFGDRLGQSTLSQVLHHQESTSRQYALKDKALALGWNEKDIRMLDGDLGMSGAQSQGRQDFKTLLADVSLGEVGAVLALEASRLARSNTDWHRLI
jgi:hypothetical protein